MLSSLIVGDSSTLLAEALFQYGTSLPAHRGGARQMPPRP